MKQNVKKQGMDTVQDLRPEDGRTKNEARDCVMPNCPRRLLGTELASEAALAEDWLSERDEEAWKNL